jgi:ABC-type nickel/cobalt efflux system permease component RcnA
VAAFLGALHAVSPGHGKTVMAAYLVGSRGSARHAIALGLTVTVSHTLGVLALAVVTLYASNLIPPERLYPVLGLLSGGLVIGIGLWLLYGRFRIWKRTRADAHAHAAHEREHHVGLAHEHAPEHVGGHGNVAPQAQLSAAAAIRRYGGASAVTLVAGQAVGTYQGSGGSDVDHDHAGVPGEHSHGGLRHSHLPPSGADLTWRSLFSLGLAGGLVPSASALLLLLGSLAANRPAYGVILVIAFGAGMAVVLAGVGLLLVYATRFVERIPTGTAGRRLWDVLPVATAVVVIGAGLYLTSQAVTQVF